MYDTAATRAHFAQFACIFSHLSSYRSQLIDSAIASGHPLIRHMALHFGYDPRVWRLEEQFMFGSDFLVAPAMDENATEVDVYIPQFSGN